MPITAAPTSSAATVVAAEWEPSSPRAVALAAMAAMTTGVASPSLSPLSRFSAWRTRLGRVWSARMPALSEASVAAREAAARSAVGHDSPGRSASPTAVPKRMARGSPMRSMRTGQVVSPRSRRTSTVDASENSDRTRVISTRTCTLLEAMLTSATPSWASTAPEARNTAGPVMPKRLSRLDMRTHPRTSSTRASRLDSVMFRSCERVGGGRRSTGRAAQAAGPGDQRPRICAFLAVNSSSLRMPWSFSAASCLSSSI
jgi:hypothetical protein